MDATGKQFQYVLYTIPCLLWITLDYGIQPYYWYGTALLLA